MSFLNFDLSYEYVRERALSKNGVVRRRGPALWHYPWAISSCAAWWASTCQPSSVHTTRVCTRLVYARLFASHKMKYIYYNIKKLFAEYSHTWSKGLLFLSLLTFPSLHTTANGHAAQRWCAHVWWNLCSISEHERIYDASLMVSPQYI